MTNKDKAMHMGPTRARKTMKMVDEEPQRAKSVVVQDIEVFHQEKPAAARNKVVLPENKPETSQKDSKKTSMHRFGEELKDQPRGFGGKRIKIRKTKIMH